MKVHRPSWLFSFLVLVSVSCSKGGGSGSGVSNPTAQVGVSGFSPGLGSVGTLVAIQGNHFDSDPFQLSVRFGGAQGVLAPVQLSTSTQILVHVPPGAATGKIAVTTPSGTSISADSFRVLPSVVSLHPSEDQGAAVGGLIEILGFGFDGEVAQNNLVSFSSVPAEVLNATTTSLSVVVPVGARTGELLVSTSEGTVSRPYTILPSITGYVPDYGFPGDVVEVRGFNFQETPGENSISFNGLAASVIAAHYDSLEVILPVGLDTGLVSVTTVDGVGVGPYFFLPTVPTILDFSPISGLPGAIVHLTGSGFLPGATEVKFNGVPGQVTFATPAEMDVTIPIGATSGPIEVSHPFGSAVSAGSFTVLQTPAITNISPTLGAWGAPITIEGANFDPILAGNVVRVQGTIAPILQATPTQIVASIPSGASSGTVSVQTAAGTAHSAQSFQVAFSRYALVANTIEKTLSSHEIDGVLGQLRFQSFVSLGASANPTSVALNASRNTVYVCDADANSVRVYSLGLDGRMVHLQTVSAGPEPYSVAIHPSGDFAYVANRNGSGGAGSVSVFAVGPSGSLSAVSSVSVGADPVAFVLHPSGQFAYVANSYDGCRPNPDGAPGDVICGNSVLAFAVNPATGALTVLQRRGVAPNPVALSMHPSGEWIYVANRASGTVQGLRIGLDGKLSVLQTIASGTNPVALGMDPLGKNLYAVNQGSNDVAAYSLFPDGSLVSLGANVPAGSSPRGIEVDFSGKAYVSSWATNELLSFSIAPSGSLSPLGSALVHRGPACVLRVDGSGPVQAMPRFAFVANTIQSTPTSTSNRIAPLFIAANGTLGISGSLLPTGNRPLSVVADPTGSFLYAANSGATGAAGLTEAISMYLISPAGGVSANGSLSTAEEMGRLKEPIQIDIDPSGSFAFSLNQNSQSEDGCISSFRIDRTPGNLGKLLPVSGSPAEIPSSYLSVVPQGGALHPTGRFYYVVFIDLFVQSLETFSVNLETGELTHVPGSVQALSFSESKLSLHPSGRFAYLLQGNNVRVRAIDANGVPSIVTGSVGATGNNPIDLVLTPKGSFLYTANLSSNNLSAFAIDSLTGALTKIDADPSLAGVQDFASDAGPHGLAIDLSGRFLFVTNSLGDSVSTFSIQPDGSLVGVGPALVTGTAPRAVTTVSTYQ